jgi:glycosyltransferase involved in cell wall biosynthesis
MRIVIDLQGCQSGSKRGGIGRYAMDLVKAMASEPRGHELWLALSALMPESIAEIRSAFDGLIPKDRIQVFELPPQIAMRTARPAKVRAAEIIREDFLQSLQPDFVYVTSLFEGFDEDVATSVGQYFPGSKTAVTLYDLIPLVHSALYFADRKRRDFYEHKIQNIKNAGLLLAISEFSRQEAIDLLDMPPDKVVNISSAVDERFIPVLADPEKSARTLNRYGIRRQFLMYTARFDLLKNQTNLIAAFALLPRELRKDYQLVIVGKGSEDTLNKLNQLAEKSGLDADEVVFPGHVVDIDLVALYNLCHLFILPSLAEGFGLPALEAMSCGTATIGSNLTSVPEVIGWSNALFDPTSPNLIAKKIHQALTEPGFLQALRDHGLNQAKKFSWRRTAKSAFDAFESHCEQSKGSTNDVVRELDKSKVSKRIQPQYLHVTAGVSDLVKRFIQDDDASSLTNQDLLQIATAVAANRSKLERLFSKADFHDHK